MDTFPLIRTKWSNEYIMAVVFFTLLLYLIPQWVERPEQILGFIAVLLWGLFIDVGINMIRFKSPTCAVSAAVTAAMLQVLAPDAPVWVGLAGITVALLVGKHIWGGTGKNPVNPAIIGLITISLFQPARITLFPVSFIMIPAVILSLPFIKVRTFASLGFMAGMLIALTLSGNLSITSIISYGVFFWGCLVITDPVTVTSHPAVGILSGLMAGFFSMYLSGSTFYIAFGVIGINIISFITERFTYKAHYTIKRSFKKSERIPFLKEKVIFRDMTGEIGNDQEDISNISNITNISNISNDEILRRIQDNGIVGLGGAAFPTYKKIRTIIECDAAQKHFIINGVECDPGLVHDKWLLREHLNEIYRGIMILCKCMNFKSVTLAVKDVSGLPMNEENRLSINEENSLKFNEENSLILNEEVRIHKIPDYYPAGAERVLIQEVLGENLDPNIIPAHIGILVLNVQTVFSIYEAVCLNQKLVSKYITVADIREKTAEVMRVRLGTKVSEIIKIISPHAVSYFSGGGCMQARITDEDDVIDMNTNFLAVGDFPYYKESHLCSNCGLCSINCPSRLKVNTIIKMADEGNLQKIRRLHPEKCISCGSCSTVCLAGRNLSLRMKKVKGLQLSNTPKRKIQAVV